MEAVLIQPSTTGALGSPCWDLRVIYLYLGGYIGIAARVY